MTVTLSTGRRLLEHARRFFLSDLWELELSSLSFLRRTAAGLLRVVLIVVRGFREDECYLRAAALTFITLVALVPILMIAFAIVKGLGAGPAAAEKLLALAAAMPEQFRAFLQQILDIVQRTHLAALGWIGVVLLAGAAVTVLAGMEAAFNRIWGIATPRHPLRRTANFISILVVVPVLVAAALALSAALSSEAFIRQLGAAAMLYRAALHAAPALAIWLAFTFLYVFMPNTRVRARPALISGLLATVLWLGWQRLYIFMQVNLAQYNGIYGTFASVPIFLGWLYISWIIVLLGAEITFAFQNASTYQRERLAPAASARARLMLTLAIVVEAAAALAGRGPRFETSAFARRRRVPVRLLNEQVGLLVRAGLMAEIAERQGAYVLTRAPESVRVRELAEVALRAGTPPEALGLREPGAAVERALGEIDQGVQQALRDLTVQDLLNAERPGPPAP